MTTIAPHPARRTHARHGILALIATGTLINYLDRTVLGIAAPALSKDLAIDPALMGVIFSAFSWSYAAAQIPGGAFLDRFGSKLTYLISLVGWSLMTLLHALASGVGMLIGLRIALGVAEAPCFPANSRIVATWFPQSERAFATGVYTVGEYIGLAFLSPILFAMLAHYGWHSLFLLGGGLGLVFSLVWWRGYREPNDHAGLGEAERAHIVAGGGLIDGAGAARIDWRDAGKLLRYRQMWGICIGQFAGNSTLVFFLTWFPSYLATERHMDWIKIGWLAVVPFIAASVGVLAGGVWSDGMLKRGISATVARKLPIVTGLLLASTIVAANYVESDGLVIAILSLAFFAQGMAALGWTLVSDIAPRGMLGITGGVFNFAANLAGIVTPLVIGAIVSATGSFVGALAYIGALALLGAFAYIVILGEVKRIEIA
jgi:ACS family D-galactonate transporter-like MFS transporter